MLGFIIIGALAFSAINVGQAGPKPAPQTEQQIKMSSQDYK